MFYPCALCAYVLTVCISAYAFSIHVFMYLCCGLCSRKKPKQKQTKTNSKTISWPPQLPISTPVLIQFGVGSSVCFRIIVIVELLLVYERFLWLTIYNHDSRHGKPPRPDSNPIEIDLHIHQSIFSTLLIQLGVSNVSLFDWKYA